MHAFNFSTFHSSRLRLKSSSLHVFLHGNISADDCARELFKPSKDLASLRICNKKIILGFGLFQGTLLKECRLGYLILGIFSHWRTRFGYLSCIKSQNL